MKKAVQFIFIVLLLGMLGHGSYAMDSLLMMKDPLVGKPVKDFTLATLEGQKNFTDFRAGQKAVIFFWATWCPHCREALQELSGRKNEIEQKNIRLVLIDIGESKEDVKAFLKKQGLQLNVFLDERSSVAEDYKIIGVPTLYFIDAAGIVKDVQHALPDDLETVFK